MCSLEWGFCWSGLDCAAESSELLLRTIKPAAVSTDNWPLKLLLNTYFILKGICTTASSAMASPFLVPGRKCQRERARMALLIEAIVEAVQTLISVTCRQAG